MKDKWAQTTLADVSVNLDNQRVPVSKLKRNKGEIPYYGATGIVDYVDDYIFNEELLLIGEDGADWSAGANTSYIIKGKSWVNNHAHVLRIKNADIRFVNNFLNYADLKNYISGTTRGKLNKSDLMKIRIPYPDLPVQSKIGDILSSIDEAIQKTDQIIQKSEELKNGLMNELLTKGIGHKKFKKTKLGEIPERWEILTMHDICTVRQGLQIAIKDRKKEPGVERYVYLTNQYIKNPDEPEYIEKPIKSVICSEDDVLMTRTGNTGLVVTDVSGVFHNNFFMVDYDRSQIEKRFLVYLLRSNIIQRIILDRAGSTTIPDLNHGDFYSIPLFLPPLIEQKAIVTQIYLIDQKLLIEKNQLKDLTFLKNGLMYDIFNQKVIIN